MADEKLVNQVEDQELNDLLDSALKDFNKEQQADKEDVSKTDTLESATDKNTVDTSEDEPIWTRDFIKDAAEQFEENLQNLIKNGTVSELGASFQRMTQTITSAITDENNIDKDNVNTDFQSTIAQALNDLSATSENLQSGADLPEMLRQTSLEDGVGAFLLFIEGMLQHMLSKETLYPTLKELVDKYPEWLEEKKTTISSSDEERFKKQLELIQRICSELEKEKDDDTEEMKRKRFETVTLLLQEVQGCGQLPEELLGEQTTPFPAFLRDVESPQNCRLM